VKLLALQYTSKQVRVCYIWHLHMCTIQ